MLQVGMYCRSPMDMALPAETNSYDSGVFALLFAEYASRASGLCNLHCQSCAVSSNLVMVNRTEYFVMPVSKLARHRIWVNHISVSFAES